jgi:hypothetical protein
MKVVESLRRGRRWGALCGVLTFCAALVVIPATPAIAASSLPYVDPSALGGIGLCDQQGNSLTQGNVDTKPFVWKAVEETPAKAPYNVSDASATLYAFQPRKGVDASGWSGQQLSTASRFTTPNHPAATMTGRDESLSAYMAAFPPQWDNLIEIRIFLSAPGQPVSSETYDAVNIKVTGDTWKVVDSTNVSCKLGNAVSVEFGLATSSAQIASLSAQSTQVGLSTPTPNPASTSGSPLAAPSTEVAGVSSGGGGSSNVLVWVAVAVVLIGGGFATIRWVRSRG